MNPWSIRDVVPQGQHLTTNQQLSCAAGARWVAAQLNDGVAEIDAIAFLLETMMAIFQRLNEPLFIVEPWFALGLEILVIPHGASRLALIADESLFDGVSMVTVRSTGAAISAEMRKTDTDLLVHEEEGGTKMLVYHHLARRTVLLATGIILPDDRCASGRTQPSWRE